MEKTKLLHRTVTDEVTESKSHYKSCKNILDVDMASEDGTKKETKTPQTNELITVGDITRRLKSISLKAPDTKNNFSNLPKEKGKYIQAVKQLNLKEVSNLDVMNPKLQKKPMLEKEHVDFKARLTAVKSKFSTALRNRGSVSDVEV